MTSFSSQVKGFCVTCFVLAALATVNTMMLPKLVVEAEVAGLQRNEDTISQQTRLLKEAIDGSIFETGKKDSSGKYEIYKYEGVSLEACLLRWRLDRQVNEARRRTLREQLEISVPLSIISVGSVRMDKMGIGYVVLMITRGRKTAIAERGRIVYNDGDEIKNEGLSTNAGIYFSDSNRARKFSRSIVSLIRYCSVKSRSRQD